MRVAIVVFAAALAVQALPAMALENFIPQGHNYSPDSPELPAFNSYEDRLNSRVDVYEAEIWTRQRTAKTFSSRLDHFSNDQEPKSGSAFIDY